MAFSATTEWFVRSTGASDNGGGFDTASTGTNYANQDSPQVTYTDLVIDAADNTKITSAANPFTALHVGNTINVTSGTGFTVQRAQVVSVAAGVATMDKPMGTVASTGGNGKLGGAVASPATINTPLVAGNRIWMRGSFTTAAVIALTKSGLDGARISLEGFSATAGDGGHATITSTNAAATSVLSITGDYWMVRHLTVDGADLSLRGLYLNSVALNAFVEDCHFKDCTQYGFLSSAASNGGLVTRCLATGCGTSGAHAGFGNEGSDVVFDRCEARDNPGNGFSTLLLWLNCVNCLSHDNALSGFYVQGDNTAPRLLYNTAVRNTLDGLRLAVAGSFAGALVRHNIFASNSGYGANSVTTDYAADDRFAAMLEANAYYNNTLGARFQVPAGSGDVTLTADPFADAAADDFSLNFALGGGLSARGLALEFGLTSTPATSDGLVDAGAVQSGGGAGSGTALAGMRDLWRELTGEFYTGPIPNATVDKYLQRGLNELNRRVRYHYEDSTTDITLVAGTGEYTVPARCMEIIHVYWNGQELKKSDIEAWRRQGVAWRLESGLPREWAFYGDKLVIYPVPDAATVAADSTPELRFVSTPRDISTYGPEQLREGDTDLAVYHGVELWSASYPDSALALARRETYGALFKEEADRVAAFYLERLTTK